MWFQFLPWFPSELGIKAKFSLWPENSHVPWLPNLSPTYFSTLYFTRQVPLRVSLFSSSSFREEVLCSSKQTCELGVFRTSLFTLWHTFAICNYVFSFKLLHLYSLTLLQDPQEHRSCLFCSLFSVDCLATCLALSKS